MDSGPFNVNLEFHSNMQKQLPTQNMIAKKTPTTQHSVHRVIQVKAPCCVLLSRPIFRTFSNVCTHVVCCDNVKHRFTF
jgi:hypothetical protein